MDRPRAWHFRCPKVKAGEKNPEMGIDSTESVVIIDPGDNSKLLICLRMVCPECGWAIDVHVR